MSIDVSFAIVAPPKAAWSATVWGHQSETAGVFQFGKSPSSYVPFALFHADIISALVLAALLWHIPGPLTLIAAVLQIGAWTINEVRS